MTAPAEQLVEWVDDDERVLGLVTRSQLRARNLLHRAVSVVVRSASGDVLVHRRADWKDLWPGYWDLAVGGVVGVGEPWAAAAHRELAEELGVEAVELVALGTFRYEDAHVAEVARVFTTTVSGPFEFADGEVVEVAWVPRADLESWAAARAVCPDSLAGVLPLLR